MTDFFFFPSSFYKAEQLQWGKGQTSMTAAHDPGSQSGCGRCSRSNSLVCARQNKESSLHWWLPWLGDYVLFWEVLLIIFSPAPLYWRVILNVLRVKRFHLNCFTVIIFTSFPEPLHCLRLNLKRLCIVLILGCHLYLHAYLASKASKCRCMKVALKPVLEN